MRWNMVIAGLVVFAVFFAGVMASLWWFARQDATLTDETEFTEGDE